MHPPIDTRLKADPKDWLAKAIRQQRRAQYDLDVQFNIRAVVDEMSIIVAPDLMDHFVEWAIDHGLNHFNSVPHDTAWRIDAPANPEDDRSGEPHFDVRFEFFYIPGKSWRIEAMSVLSGNAPLHAGLPDGSIVHASFKTVNEPSYEQMKQAMEDQFMLRAEYKNTYGKFAYYGVEGMLPYFKPRVNLRDN